MVAFCVSAGQSKDLKESSAKFGNTTNKQSNGYRDSRKVKQMKVPYAFTAMNFTNIPTMENV